MARLFGKLTGFEELNFHSTPLTKPLALRNKQWKQLKTKQPFVSTCFHQLLACFHFANVNSLMLSESDLTIHKNHEVKPKNCLNLI